MLGSSPTSVIKIMVPSNKRLVHRAFNPEMLGSSPAGITVAIVQRSVPQIVDLKIWVQFPLVTNIYNMKKHMPYVRVVRELS